MLSKLRIEEFVDNRRISSYDILFKEGIKLIREEIEKKIKDKKEGDVITLTIPKAYGEKKKELITLIPVKILRKHNIKPIPGLVINIDGMEGVIRTVSGGRVIVDFNHPLAEKDVTFKVKIIKIFESEVSFVEELIKNVLKTEHYNFNKEKKEIIVDKKELIPILEEIFKIYKLDEYKIVSKQLNNIETEEKQRKDSEKDDKQEEKKQN